MMLVGALGPEPPAIFFMKQGGSIATRAARDNTANAVDMLSIFIGNKSFVVVHGRIGVEHCLLPQGAGICCCLFLLISTYLRDLQLAFFQTECRRISRD